MAKTFFHCRFKTTVAQDLPALVVSVPSFDMGLPASEGEAFGKKYLLVKVLISRI